MSKFPCLVKVSLSINIRYLSLSLTGASRNSNAPEAVVVTVSNTNPPFLEIETGIPAVLTSNMPLMSICPAASSIQCGVGSTSSVSVRDPGGAGSVESLAVILFPAPDALSTSESMTST